MRLLEGFVQEINSFTMAGGREKSRTVKQWPGVIVFLSRGIWTRRTGGRAEGRTLEFRNFLKLLAIARPGWVGQTAEEVFLKL